ncbi:MAG: RNA polymerase subunit sigma-24 [Acidobacteria bacterium]|nr:MAG: RNA polymerase subunit sigma-24 [Acidobacteriota bacterium]PYT46829.1 MAG: RNA polymerase subunit sigma-24 [Acidobacteriota bacterium]PYT59209.1 MAG: RNA polymerase subunit sigma-24 [Acidobacteriota bacterium]
MIQLGGTMATQAAVGIQLNEEKLIRAGQRGDEQAVEALFRRYHRPLFQTALRVLGNTEDAEDALQDGLLSAYRNLNRFEGRSQFSTWLTRIVINAALMRRRSAKARPAISLDETPREEELPASERFADDGPNPEQVFASTEIREMISENLDELSPLLRTAFVLREVQGFSTGEAAKKLGVTENTLKARLWRARHQLAERLGRRLRRMKDGMTGGMGDPECSYC